MGGGPKKLNGRPPWFKGVARRIGVEVVRTTVRYSSLKNVDLLHIVS